MFFLSPLEQFQILPIISLRLGNFDLSFTNGNLIILIAIGSFFLLMNMLLSVNGSFYVVPSRWQIIIETFYETIANMLYDNLGTKGQQYFPFVFVLFMFVLLSNLIGLIPYSFTITSHLIVTFALALMVFIGVNIICIKEHGLHMVSLFLPPGTSLGLALLLVPIEFVSYMFKPISLGVRLFANMMAGHTLLKVIAGFAWSMMISGGLLFIAHIVPLLVLVLLVGLELGVAMIQAYVFTILTCIYLNDAINLH
jgi:ATP synthase subunit 6